MFPNIPRLAYWGRSYILQTFLLLNRQSGNCIQEAVKLEENLLGKAGPNDNYMFTALHI